MLSVFLACLDQFRAVAGLIAACFLFCRHAVPRRDRYALRTAVCCGVCLAVGFAYVPLISLLASMSAIVYGSVSAVYWILITALVSISVYCCYEISLQGILFRVILGYAHEIIVTTVVRYLIVMMWAPNLPEHHPAAYIMLTLVIYMAMYYAVYRLLARRLQRGGTELDESLGSFSTLAFSLLALTLIIFATNVICEGVIPSMGNDPAYQLQFELIRYFCIGIRFMVCTAFIVSHYYIYENSYLQYERDMIGQLMKEKSAQYEFNRENIEFIRRKCHDLKHQLRALELAGDDERKAVLEETRRAAAFYDAAVQTGNEVLDTLLTEKNLLCTNRGIRLTCTVSAKEIGRIGVVDLYTILSNALDNAIECVEQLTDPEKKTISFSVTERVRMLLIEVENYYEGSIQMKGGFPVTHKDDKENHGIGVRSIHTLAKRYGGDIRISVENQLFLLQIMLPISQLPNASGQ